MCVCVRACVRVRVCVCVCACVCACAAILNLDNTVVDLETLQALYENVSRSFSLSSSAALRLMIIV